MADISKIALSIDGKLNEYNLKDSDARAKLVNMIGATSSTAGKSGLVPTPSAGDQKKFLKADGTWDTPEGKYLVQSGLVTSFTEGKMTVNFPTAYTNLLGVSVIPWLSAPYFCTLSSSSTTGFTIQVWKSTSTSPVQSSATVKWFAIGEV